MPLYHVDRTIRELSEQFQDEAHIIYVNGQYRGNDPVGSVMHDFFCADPKDMNNEILADEVAKYKDTDKGVSSMCRIMEELTNESRQEGRAEGRIEGRVEGRVEVSVKCIGEKPSTPRPGVLGKKIDGVQLAAHWGGAFQGRSLETASSSVRSKPGAVCITHVR